MNAGCILQLHENLKNLTLGNIARHLEERLRQAEERGASYEEFLLELTELELRIRFENREKRRLKEARFPLVKTLGTFTFEEAPQLDRRLIGELAAGDYISRHRNILFLGKSGCGKTHLATALGIEACRKNMRVRFTTACNLVDELLESRSDKTLARTLGKYTRYDLLIVDELGYVPFSKEGGELLFQVFAERHERGSVIVTTNLGFGSLTEVFGRLRNEMFYNRTWTGVSVDEFMEILNGYLYWYNEKRITMSLGTMSPLEFRNSLNLAA